MNWIVGVLDISLIKQFDMMIKELLPYGPYPRQGEIPEIRRRISEHRFEQQTQQIVSSHITTLPKDK